MKLFSCSSQLSTKFILLINVKMPTIVGILTFISMINTTSERLKAKHFFICRYFSFNEQLKCRAQVSRAWKSFITSGSGMLSEGPRIWIQHTNKTELVRKTKNKQTSNSVLRSYVISQSNTLRDVSYNARWFWTTIRYGPMTTAYLCWTTGNGF